jgi:hypothetical protein
MPLIVPRKVFSSVTGTPLLPAAVLAVWLPWPSASRAERNS